MVASIFSKNVNNEVTVLERNSKPLKKLLITGNGKCNFFNDDFSIGHYYSDDKDILSSIINDDNKKKVFNFLESIGIVPRVKNGYYYPNSNQAFSVYNSLVKEASIKGVNVIYDTTVLNIVKISNEFIIDTNNGRYICDKVIISTGSKAYPKTGSCGDGYLFGSSFRHSIVPVYPALVQLVSNNKFIKDLSGVRSDACVSLISCGKVIKSEVGEVQFTDYGLSGICIFNLSILVHKLKDVSISINFFNDFGLNDFSSFMDFFDERILVVKNRTVSELLEGFLNYKIVNVVLKLCGIDSNLCWGDLSNSLKKRLALSLISFSVDIIDTKDFDNSQVCVGGVSLSEIDINTFESRIVSGLYFTGEVLDVTGDCGGYNLGFAFLSGMIAGKSVGGFHD